MLQQTCPYSGEKFTPKRRNQVFATSKNRRDYHNEIEAVLRDKKATIDNQLKRNFIILSELLPEGETKTFKKDELLLQGFNPVFFTHLDILNGKTSHCLYRFIFHPSENQDLLTITNKNND